MNFQNRDRPLRILNECYARQKPIFMVVYGRRRIGKTVLLRHWIEDHIKGKHLLWTAHRTTSEVLLASEAVADVTPGVHSQIRFSSWEALFEQLFRVAEAKRLVVVIDEFPYLVECAPEIPSVLQKLWDRHKEKSLIFLHYHPIGHKNSSCALGLEPIYGRLFAESV